MKFNLIIIFVFLIYSLNVLKGQSLSKQVLKTIERTEQYDQDKIDHIKSIRRGLGAIDKSNTIKLYEKNLQLYDEFKVFKQDSAFHYGLRLLNLAKKLDSIPLIASANFHLGEICVSGGMYEEAQTFLKKVDVDDLSNDLKPLFYGLYGRLYDEMSEYSDLTYFTSKYEYRAKRYRLKALNHTEGGTFFNRFLNSTLTHLIF